MFLGVFEIDLMHSFSPNNAEFSDSSVKESMFVCLTAVLTKHLMLPINVNLNNYDL